ncbi:MAG: peptidylprolyl isomerase [Burkholderiales bacterium]|jgi:peptidyl-prolyl cis-trans isomerase SurA|tara:strand:+ start:144 stop:1424 length:1281 start_codon:yes stop_codon:yes gene_type:complete
MNFLLKFFLLFSISTAVYSDELIPLDRVVAIVGDGVITELELNKETSLTRQNIVNSGSAVPDLIYLRQQVLERMITRKVLTNLADRTGIRVSDAEVRRALQRLAKEQNLSVDDYMTAIDAKGLSVNALRENIVLEAKILKLRRRDVEAKLIVNDSEIKSYLEKRESETSDQNESLIAHILITIPENVTSEDLKRAQDKVAEAILKIDEGLDFRRVAAELSEATDALEGGVMGWRDASNLPELFIDALSEMRIGQRSDVLRSANGLHILYLLDKRGRDAQIIVQQTLARHILFRVDRIVSDEDALIKATEVRNRIVMGGEDFETLARSASDDPSGSKGGVLGWLMPGETVPEFEQALARLAVGEVSELVRTQFGYHVIEVLDRRDSDVSEDRQIAVARQALTQRKLEFRFEEWVREVRDTTFIKYVN